MENIKRLNKKLDETYGRSDDGRPFFRISWSDSQTEKRFGTFREWLGTGPGAIFLREYTGVSERRKYPDIRERWVLEKLIFPSSLGIHDWDLINGSYEPIWTFEGPGGSYQKPEWWACEMICKIAIYGPAAKITQADEEEIEQKAFDKAVAHNLDILQNDEPDLVNAMRHGEAIVVPTTFEKS